MGHPPAMPTPRTHHVQRTLERDEIVLSDGLGEIRVKHVTPNIVHARSSGHVRVGLASALGSEAVRIMGEVGRVHFFVDLWNQTTMETGVRHFWKNWFEMHGRQHLASSHILFRPTNRLLAMVLEVMLIASRSGVLAPLPAWAPKMYPNLTAFQKALADVKLPSPPGSAASRTSRN